MFHRATLIGGIALMLLTACAPAGAGGLAREGAPLSAAAALGTGAQAAANEIAPAPQASPTIQFQFPPPAPNMTPGPTVVAPSAIDDHTPPPPHHLSPSPAQPAAGPNQLVQPTSPTVAGSAQGLLAYVVHRT